MASQDFFYDTADKLAKDDWQYIIVYMKKPKKGKKNSNVSLLYRLTNKKSSHIMASALSNVSEELANS